MNYLCSLYTLFDIDIKKFKLNNIIKIINSFYLNNIIDSDRRLQNKKIIH